MGSVAKTTKGHKGCASFIATLCYTTIEEGFIAINPRGPKSRKICRLNFLLLEFLQAFFGL